MKKVSLNIFKRIGKLPGKKIIIPILLFLMFVLGFAAYRVSDTHYLVFDEIIPKAIKANDYEIDATYYEEEKILEGTEKIKYINNSNHSLKDIYFHVYPNVFNSEETTPFNKDEMGLAYKDGFEAGYININSIQIAQKDSNYLIMGKGNSILKVNLEDELQPNEDVIIHIKFTVKIPPANGRFGYGKNTINLGNWYPIASVLDESGWNLEPYYPIGDPFYSDVGNYRVTLAMPSPYVVASTGDLVKKESIDGKYKWTFTAERVRDFALIASTRFKVLEDKVNDTSIRTYYFDDEAAELSLKSAKDSIEIFNDTFGEYPYEHFSVAASDFFIGGMEYPKLVFIDEGLYKGNNEILEYVIVHEAAHQWWYGLVGNNEIEEAWLDEALTEYSTMLYYEKKYGIEGKDKMYKKMVLGGYDGYRNFSSNNNEIILKELKDFESSREYQALVYCKGAMFFESLRKELGEDSFFDALKIYFDKYKYQNATTADFIEVCEIVSDRELDHIFEEWLMDKKE